MPTYELRCRECGHVFDRFLTRLLRTEDKVCPECGSREVTPGVGGGVAGRVSSASTGSCASASAFR